MARLKQFIAAALERHVAGPRIYLFTDRQTDRWMDGWMDVRYVKSSVAPPQLLYDGVPQPLTVIGLDGVPVGTPPAGPVGAAPPTTLKMPGARRAEIIVRGPDATVADARLVTLAVDTGPDGDSAPARPLLQLVVDGNATAPSWRMPVPALPPKSLGLPAPAASWLYRASPNVSRLLFFSQDPVDPANPLRPVTQSCFDGAAIFVNLMLIWRWVQVSFYLTVDGNTPVR
jgi:hypothetical protein